ncbi:heme-binding protein 2-like [Solea solea]|uniref:heme-binding protein 2-like n=1 Tax=Solea solea TaxID=90069 RepID=UPI00272A6122|nr:heme-binding protein 2-like [Solea solea]
MFCVSGLVVFMLVLTAEARVGNSSELEFCTDTKECLLYKEQICKNDDYEVRHYESAKWASTNMTTTFDLAAFSCFQYLFKYIRGENDGGHNIEMTSPVVMTIPEVKYTFLGIGMYEMSFLLPSEYQMNPPKPTDLRVYISETPDRKVYVKNYSEFFWKDTDEMHANSLSNKLDSVGANFKRQAHHAAVYNYPFSMDKKHNEVWFVAEGEPVCFSED